MTIVEGQRWRRGARREFVSYILHSVSTTQCVRGKRLCSVTAFVLRIIEM